jgi:hypothetical protein
MTKQIIAPKMDLKTKDMGDSGYIDMPQDKDQ